MKAKKISDRVVKKRRPRRRRHVIAWAEASALEAIAIVAHERIA